MAKKHVAVVICMHYCNTVLATKPGQSHTLHETHSSLKVNKNYLKNKKDEKVSLLRCTTLNERQCHCQASLMFLWISNYSMHGGRCSPKL